VLADRIGDVAEPHGRLAAVRSALHERTGRAVDRLALQEQDGVADAMGFADADVLMADVSSAGRKISYASDDGWDRIATYLSRGRRPREMPDRDPNDWLGAAVEAARTGVPISRATLARFESQAPAPPVPWTEPWRHNLVALLGAGANALPVLEALDQHGLLVRLLPEWETVRHKPQRNAYHRFTVDRHLWEAAAQAAALTRAVSRPDLLLVGALLHDLGKGQPGDHTDAGIRLIRDIAPRMGFSAADAEVLEALVRHHLLLPDVATRRDLSDPATIDHVAAEVGDVDTLELLAALTEADSLATGPSAWSDWKAGLVRELVSKTRLALLGAETGALAPAPASDPNPKTPSRHVAEVEVDVPDGLRGEGNHCTVVAADRPGLFSKVAGVLALHGLDVRSATAGPTTDGRAIEEIEVEPAFGKQPNWPKVAADLDSVLEGKLPLEARLADRARNYERRYRASAAQPAEARVLVDNDASERATVVEVRAPDGVAVLYRITSALAACGLDVRVARVSTLGHEVVDAFYVVGADGEKVTDAAALAEVESALLAQLG
jgi:[protein-PII] uridylyltransferase